LEKQAVNDRRNVGEGWKADNLKERGELDLTSRRRLQKTETDPTGCPEPSHPTIDPKNMRKIVIGFSGRPKGLQVKRPATNLKKQELARRNNWLTLTAGIFPTKGEIQHQRERKRRRRPLVRKQLAR